VSVATPRPLLQNLVDADVVDESNVFGGTGDDNDDFFLSLINADLAVTALSFANVAVLLGYLIQAAR
jgi:hypothetical protein